MPLLTTAAPAPPSQPAPRLDRVPVVTWTSADGQTVTLTDSLGGYTVMPGARGLGMTPYELFTQSSAAVDGDRITGVRALPREIMLPIDVTADTRDEAVARFHALVRSMRPKQGDGTLTLAEATGLRRSIGARYHAGMEGSERVGDAGVRWWKFGIVLHVSEPYWIGTPYENSWDTGGTSDTWLPWGPQIPVRNSQIIGLGMEIVNAGDAEAYPIWTIHGPVASGMEVTNQTTGKTWTLNRALAIGETATIDCRQRVQTAELGDGTDLWPDLSEGAVLWPMAPGENVVDLVVSGTDANTLVELKFDTRYEIAYAHG